MTPFSVLSALGGGSLSVLPGRISPNRVPNSVFCPTEKNLLRLTHQFYQLEYGTEVVLSEGTFWTAAPLLQYKAPPLCSFRIKVREPSLEHQFPLSPQPKTTFSQLRGFF